jgi:hypothetical protein
VTKTRLGSRTSSTKILRILYIPDARDLIAIVLCRLGTTVVDEKRELVEVNRADVLQLHMRAASLALPH